jgi:hypothetical protein
MFFNSWIRVVETLQFGLSCKDIIFKVTRKKVKQNKNQTKTKHNKTKQNKNQTWFISSEKRDKERSHEKAKQKRDPISNSKNACILTNTF